MLRLSNLKIIESRKELGNMPEGKVLVNTINAHSFNTAQGYPAFAEALTKGDYLIPDGFSIVLACRLLRAKSRPVERVTGWNLFEFEMQRLEERSRERVANGGERMCVMFLGSSEHVLGLIRRQAAVDYPNLEVVTYSPPYKPEFTEEDNAMMVKAINEAQPDLLWIGMTAPKQETWTYAHWSELDIHCHVGTVGAVFDFYAETKRRAPRWMQDNAQEWLFRLISEPRRMWRRYLLGNPKFFWNILKEGCSRRKV